MSIRVSVKSAEVTEKPITTKKGKPMVLRSQAVYAHTADRQGRANPYPERVELLLDDGQPPYAVGDYTLSPASFFVGAFHRLEVSPRLTPIKPV